MVCRLEEGSISSFLELTRAFGARFVTCSRVPRPLDSLLSMAMQEGETLKTYLDRYWEMFNEIDGNFDDIAVRARFAPKAQMKGQWSKELKKINLLKSGLKDELSMR